MSLTVRQILEVPELSGMKLIAGESGIEKNIRSVNVMEAPDIARWLRGGELLLSTGYQFRNDVEGFEALIMAIHAAGAAALGFKNRFLQEFPPKAKDCANGVGLPILSLPLELPYSDIIRIVIMQTDEVENIRFSESVLRSFSEILTEGGGIVNVLQNLALFLKCRVCFLDERTGKFSYSSGEFLANENSATNKRALLEKYPHEQLVLSHRAYGTFIFENRPQDAMWRVVLEHAKVAMLLVLQKDIATRQVEARYRNEFVQDLATGNIRDSEEVINRARSFGWDLAGKLRVVVFDIDNYKIHFEQPLPREKVVGLEEAKERIYSICKNEMRLTFQNLPYLTRSDFIAFIVNVDNYPNFKTRLRQCCKDVQEKTGTCAGYSVSVGVGNEKCDFFGTNESYDEARRAIKMMRAVNGDGGFHVWDEMGILTVLAPVADSEEARKFFVSRLGGLAKDNDLLHTLDVLVKQNWNFRAAARELNIHYNTIHYRYEKICEISNVDLSTGEKRLEIAVALKLLYLNPKLGSA
ncbi:MAG: PucR family transcriptional regulator ligand-binding domain-containing protein [Synergistaceae bacterium]|nr:PucR family transcriptional regulator ligand-binding domain-containing protein [Synergistaceae bacterium]